MNDIFFFQANMSDPSSKQPIKNISFIALYWYCMHLSNKARLVTGLEKKLALKTIQRNQQQ